ncbi:MAG: DUF1667 domain-containing protein [Clostridiaceae bacterium]|nr:DUF1667 domain-containing protein [Clostridiaceae bacterium]
MKKEIICIICPRGCHIQVEGKGDVVERIENNQCQRGYEYAEAEFINPCRILTTSVKLEGVDQRKMLPVRSNKAIPKDMLLPCMVEVKKQVIKAPVSMHQVIIKDILGTGADMVACMPIEWGGK